MIKMMLALTRIVQEVSMMEEPSAQVRKIVDSISDVIHIDVCSLYRKNQLGEMVLLDSHGLVTSQAVKIPANKGLVGLVANSRHPVNISNAPAHPDYYFVPNIHEEQFPSFCGIPLVRLGEVIGVLVVQSRSPTRLDDADEAFLVTLGSHLALIVAAISPMISVLNRENLRVSGFSGAPGIGIGSVHLCARNCLNDVALTKSRDPLLEVEKWHQLLAQTRAQIKLEQASISLDYTDNVSGIFEAYLMLLSDPALSERILSEIRGGQSLPSALKLSFQYFSGLFRAMEDPYLKARHEDMSHLGNKLYQVWLSENNDLQINDGPVPDEGQVILSGAQISVSDIASIPIEKLAGIVCFNGSVLSHTAVLANALGIPAVMGVGEIKGLKVSERIILDGNTGQIIRSPSELLLEEYQKLVTREQSFTHELDKLRDLPARTQDAVKIRLLTNTGLLADIKPGLKNGAEGVGLYRTEIPFMVRQSFPSEEEQIEVYRDVFAAYQGKPVYVRTLDIGGDKQLPYYPITNEENPALGWRGIRFSLDNIQLLMTQVRAIIRSAEGRENLHILLPMISCTQELNQFLALLDDACKQLYDEGLNIVKPRVGVMVEVPAVTSQLQYWKQKIDFVSIGSNDLSQYLLAVDRNNPRVAKRFDHVHPAVLHEIYRIVNSARDCELPLNLCGEMASDPVAVLLLLGMGVRSLSMSSSKLPRIKWLIRSVSITQAEEFLKQALEQDNVESIRALGAKTLKSLGLGALLNTDT
ncbi:MAG: phosphoenolpyruvate--protein phosphotransferase [Gammaproteobacteria bacterium]|nr:phosphoenolpyruvate--protein phosphotransferase [Gammaproteobacteria bacterium]